MVVSQFSNPLMNCAVSTAALSAAHVHMLVRVDSVCVSPGLIWWNSFLVLCSNPRVCI